MEHSPWELVPFVLSMFIFVLALDYCGITDIIIGKALGNILIVPVYGFTSVLAANLINNIPMSVLFGNIVSLLSSSDALYALYSTIIGSNIGAFLTPIGALAGIMWLGILKKQKIKFGFLRFVKYGIFIALPTLCASLSGLYVTLMV